MYLACLTDRERKPIWQGIMREEIKAKGEAIREKIRGQITQGHITEEKTHTHTFLTDGNWIDSQG